MLRRGLIVAIVGGLFLSGDALAAPAVNGEFDIPGGVGSNNEITQGPDGNMWVTRESVSGVARITPDGTVTPFPIANTALGITVGPDGNIWVSTPIGVTRIPPSDPANDQAFNLGFAADGAGITTGPDGKMWVVSGDKLVSYSTGNPEGTVDPNTIAGMVGPKGLATGSDGLLWIAAGSTLISATATATPVTTSYTVGAGLQDVAAGPNGQVAYAAANDNEIGLLTSPGPPNRIPIETSDPFGVTFGNDGAYWIARSSKDDLMRLAPDGSRTTLTGFSPSGNVGPRKVATGPNNTLWVTLDQQEKVARVTGVDPPTPPGGGTAPETRIDKAPKNKLKTKKPKAKVKYRFSSTTAGATFECSLEKKNKAADYEPCTSPESSKVKAGKHEFEVRAVAGGLTDASPATDAFKVVRKKRN